MVQTKVVYKECLFEGFMAKQFEWQILCPFQVEQVIKVHSPMQHGIILKSFTADHNLLIYIIFFLKQDFKYAGLKEGY